MKNILVPVDFSQASLNSLEYAMGLNEKAKANLIIVHAAEGLNNDNAEKQLLELSRKCLAHDHSVQTKMVMGKPIDALLKAIKEDGIDYVVIGTSGKSGSILNPFGSVAELVVRNANVPVMVIPPQVEWKGMNSLVFASDFSKQLSPEAYSSVNVITDDFSVMHHFLKIITPEVFERTVVAIEKMKKFGESADMFFATMTPYCDYTVAGGIKSFTEEIPVSAVVMGTHGFGSFTQLLNRSEAEKTIRELTVPIITFKLEV